MITQHNFNLKEIDSKEEIPGQSSGELLQDIRYMDITWKVLGFKGPIRATAYEDIKLESKETDAESGQALLEKNAQKSDPANKSLINSPKYKDITQEVKEAEAKSGKRYAGIALKLDIMWQTTFFIFFFVS